MIKKHKNYLRISKKLGKVCIFIWLQKESICYYKFMHVQKKKRKRPKCQTTYPSRHVSLQRLMKSSVYLLKILSNRFVNLGISSRGNMSQIFNTWMYFISFTMSIEQTTYRPSTLYCLKIADEFPLIVCTFRFLGLQPPESLSRRLSTDFFKRIDFSFLNDFRKISLKST